MVRAFTADSPGPKSLLHHGLVPADGHGGAAPVGMAFGQVHSDNEAKRRHTAVEPTLAKQPAQRRRSHAGSFADRVMVPPEALAELHRLHDELMGMPTTSDDLWEQDLVGVSNETLASCWGRGGSWHVCARLPEPGMFDLLLYGADVVESPFSQRGFSLYPGSSINPEFWLESLGVAVVNMKGYKGHSDTKVGQDNFSVTMLESGWHCFCCADGHGTGGDWPAQRAVSSMPFFLQSRGCNMMLGAFEVESALLRAFEMVEADLVESSKDSNVSLQSCGSTFTCVMHRPGSPSVWLAHVGDSRATLVPRCGPGAGRETTDHSLQVPAEEERVERCGGDIVHFDVEMPGEVEARVYARGKTYPGIAMTRSLGDLCVKEYGVIAEPEIVKWPLTSEDEATLLLLASDGIWNVFSSDEAADFVRDGLKEGKSRWMVAVELAKLAKERWLEGCGDYCDDVTVMLLPLAGARFEELPPDQPPNAISLRWLPFSHAICCSARAGLTR